MSGNPNGHREDVPVIVRVVDTVDAALSGRDGAVYQSPPQSREQAMTLVRLLLGVGHPRSGGDRWVAPSPVGDEL